MSLPKHFFFIALSLSLSLSGLGAESNERELEQGDWLERLYLRLLVGSGSSKLIYYGVLADTSQFQGGYGETYLLEGKLNVKINENFHIHAGYSFHSTPNAESNIRVPQKGEYSFQSKALTYGASFFVRDNYYFMAEHRSILDLNINGKIGQQNYEGHYAGNGYSFFLGRDWYLSENFGLNLALIYTRDLDLVRKDKKASVLSEYQFFGFVVGINYY